MADIKGISILCALAGMGAFGCSVEIGESPESSSNAGEEVASTTQEVWTAWSPAEWSTDSVGMARTRGGRPYAWYKDGWVCRGREG